MQQAYKVFRFVLNRELFGLNELHMSQPRESMVSPKTFEPLTLLGYSLIDLSPQLKDILIASLVDRNRY
jgi:hypothetical protein